MNNPPRRESGTRNGSERREEIVRLVTARGVVAVEDLAETLAVTASTIRRDLARLTESGRLARTYGGVMAVGPHRESPLVERSGEELEAKRGIGLWSAAQVGKGETILLDAGTTAGQVAAALHGQGPLTVATTGLTSLTELSGTDDVEVLCLGGRLRHISQGLVGPMVETALERLSFDRVFLGADGVTADRGICEATLEQTRLKELMWRDAGRTYVLAHAAKLGRRPFHAWAALPPSWTLVTDEGADEELLTPFRERGVDVVVVDGMGQRRDT